VFNLLNPNPYGIEATDNGIPVGGRVRAATFVKNVIIQIKHYPNPDFLPAIELFSPGIFLTALL